MNAVSRLVGAVALFTLATPGLGQVVFTVTATANSSVYGYTAGQSYTFVFTAGSSFGPNGMSAFDSSQNFWLEETTTEDQLWSSVSGTGALGTYVRPTSTSDAPYSNLATYTGNRLVLLAGADIGTIGVTAPSGSALKRVEFDLTGLTGFAFPGTYSQPNSYFSVYNGSYTPSGSISGVVVVAGDFTSYGFTVSGVSIGAVPEPATYAALAGVAVLGCALWRRRAYSFRPCDRSAEHAGRVR
jgi:hypothetical protein